MAFSSGATGTASDTFSFLPGADGSALEFTGLPATFSLVDGRTVTSAVSSDGLTVTGTDSDGDLFYTLTLSDGTPNDGLWTQTFTMFQNAPTVTNPIDFSSVSAGGPKEVLTAENISFDGGFFTPLSGGEPEQIVPASMFTANSSDDINPNNAGGIGIGNGNIEEGEVLLIDMSATPEEESGVEFVLQGVGGGISKTVDVLWVAYQGDRLVASDTVTANNITVKGGATVTIQPENVTFDRLYVAIDPDSIDSNDVVRINQISTLSQQGSDDIDLTFSVWADEDLDDPLGVDGDVTQEETFTWTISTGSELTLG